MATKLEQVYQIMDKGGGFPPLLTRLLLVTSFMTFGNLNCLFHNDIILVSTSEKGFEGRKRQYDVIITSNCNLMLLFELSASKLVFIPNLSSVSL